MDLRYFKGNPIFPFEGKSRQVQAVWEMKLQKGETVVPHEHPDGDEIYIVLGGIGEMLVGDNKNTDFEGDVVFIPSNSVHHAANKIDVPFHCVGVLLSKADAKAKASEVSKDEDVLGRLDAKTAVMHLLRILAFAAEARRKLEGERGTDKAEIERQTQIMEQAVMKGVERILKQYKGG
jgi:quercetin dioxygenase-like cupin family protein